MNEVKVFNHKLFGDLPIIIVDGVEFFGATEAAKSLSFSKPHDAIKNHVDEDDSAVHGVTDRLGRIQQKKFINESGLYSLIFGAAKQGNSEVIKQAAKQFKRWVTHEVLPSIRKHGAYMTPDTLQQAIANPDFTIGLLTNLKEEQEKRQAAETKLEHQRPKVLFADSVEASESSILIRELAVILKQNGINTGEKRLFEWLRDNGYLVKRFGSDRNSPTQKSMNMGLFEIKETPINHNSGVITVNKTTKVTGKGQVYFINKFLSSQKAI